MSGIYVITINGDVATVAQMDEPTVARIRAQIEDEPFVEGRVVGPVTITTVPYQIEAEVEQALDTWRL